MDLRRAGVRQVRLCGSRRILTRLAEHLSLRAGDPRLPRVGLLHQETPGPVLVLDGGRVYHPALIEDAVSRGGDVAYLAPGGEPAGIGVVSGNPGESSEVVPLPFGTFAHPAQSPADRRAAERLIFKSLTKPADGWVSRRLNRPVSTRISRILAGFPVHPNLITVLALLAAGVPAAIFSALGTYLGFAVGGALFQLNSILDGVDGEVARVKHLESRRGEWFDTVCDTLSNLLYLAGVTIGTWRALESDLLLWCGIGAVGLHILEIAAMFWIMLTRFGSGSKSDYQWEMDRPGARDKPLNRLLRRLKPFTRQDFYALLFAVLALSGLAWVTLPTAMIAGGAIVAVVLAQTRSARYRASA